VLEAQGSVMTNKYAEGYPGGALLCGCRMGRRRRDAGDRARQELFGAHLPTSTHSGSQMNQAVFLRSATARRHFYGPRSRAGGHLTHGAPSTCPANGSRRSITTVRRDDQIIDMDDVARRAEEVKRS